MSLAIHATYLRDLYGMAIHPVKARDKAPVVADWPRRMWTVDDLTAWYADHPDDNMGLVCGATGWVALDLDGAEWVQWATDRFPPTPLRTVSGSGAGGHFIYRWPVGEPIAKRALYVPGLPDSRRDKDSSHKGGDLYGDGTQIVLPPSIHPSGGRYRWVDCAGPFPPIDTIPIFNLAWLPPPRSEPHAVAAPSLDDRSMLRAAAWIAKRDPAVQGQRGHDHTYATCCTLVAQFMLSESDAWSLLVNWNQRCLPPWGAPELRAQLRSAMRGAKGGPAEDRRPPVQTAANRRVLPLDDGADFAPPAARKQRSKSLDDIARERMESLRTKTRIITTGITALDDGLSGGVRAGEFVVVGARTGQGKSFFGMQLAEHASKQGPVLVASLEMTGEDFADRAIESRSRLTARELRAGGFDEYHRGLANAALVEWCAHPIRILEDDDFTLADLELELDAMPGVSMLVLDYIQLMKAEGKHQSREREVAVVSRELRMMAKRRKILVVGLAQLNDKADKRTDRRPAKGDLRESRSLEMDAQVIILLWTPDPKAPDVREIIVDKCRYAAAPIGSGVHVTFDSDTLSFWR